MAGRPRKISVKKVGKIYVGKFYNSESKRVTKSFRTESKVEADLIKKELELLQENPSATVRNIAHTLFFGESKELVPSFRVNNDDYLELIADYQSRIKILEKRISQLEQFEEKYLALIQEKEYKRIEEYKNLPTFEEVLEKYKQVVSHLDRNGMASI